MKYEVKPSNKHQEEQMAKLNLIERENWKSQTRSRAEKKNMRKSTLNTPKRILDSLR